MKLKVQPIGPSSIAGASTNVDMRAVANSNVRRNLIEPRLLTVQEAAHYLHFKSTAALKNIPIKPIHLAEVGVGKGPKYDLHALDRWLDRLSGLAQQPTPSTASPNDEADAELAAWRAKRATRVS